MSKFITVVIKYEDLDEQPEFRHNMAALGGIVSAVQFNDALAEMEEMEDYIQELEQNQE